MHSFTLPIVFMLALFPYASCSSISFIGCSHEFRNIDRFLLMEKERNSTKCKKLTTLRAQFAWNYYTTSNNETSMDILIGTKMISDTGWLAWGVNPYVPQMAGSRAIIAIMLPDENAPVVNTYNITKDIKLGCTLQASDIDVKVQNKTAEYNNRSGFFTMSATVILPQIYNISSLNHVWQVGYVAQGSEPKMHPANLQNVDSKEVLDLKTGHFQNVGYTKHHLRQIHGILNIIGWGTLLPTGVIIARYFREFPFNLENWWFKFHYSCQALGYILGSIGWGLGLLLGHESKYYTFRTHRLLGICVFVFTTLQVTQMLAFRLKPTRGDEYRKHWNVYHHFLGYSLLVIIAVNIYQGIKILKPDNGTWKWAYNGILVLLAMVAFSLEVYTWVKFLCKKYKRSNRSNVNESSQKKNVNESSQGVK